MQSGQAKRCGSRRWCNNKKTTTEQVCHWRHCAKRNVDIVLFFYLIESIDGSDQHLMMMFFCFIIVTGAVLVWSQTKNMTIQLCKLTRQYRATVGGYTVLIKQRKASLNAV